MTVEFTTSKLNNFEEMLSNVSKMSDNKSLMLDKSSKNFEKIFDKSLQGVNEGVNRGVNKENVYSQTSAQSVLQVERAKSKINGSQNISQEDNIQSDKSINIEDLKKVLNSENVEEGVSNLKEVLSKTLSILKDIKSNSELSGQIVDWAEFKEELASIIAEANVETSLDLTLAKDVAKIIEQLQEAVENIDENINIENEIAIDDKLMKEEEENSEQEIPFEQIISMLNKPVKIDNSESLTELNVELDDKLTFENDFSNETFEVVENSEILPEENLVNKTEDRVDIQELEKLLDEDLLKDLNIESMQAESDSSFENAFYNSHSAEEHSIKAVVTKDIEVFDIKLENAQNTTSTQTAGQVQAKTVEINPSRILEQISKQLDGLQNGSKVNIVLNPESLGKVNIQLLSTKEGLTAQLTVSTQEARDLLMKGLDGLKDALTAQGVAFDNVSVKVANAEKSEYNQDWTEQEGSRGGNKGQKNPDREEKEKGLFEQMMAQELDLENGNV